MSAVLKAQEPSARYMATVTPTLVRQFDLMATAPGGVAQLRELILTLAVQGKLLPHRPTDEPANALLNQICERRARLAAEAQERVTAPMPAIGEDEKPFDLPDGWEWVRIDGLAHVQGGIQKTPLRRPVQHHFPYLRVANVQRDRLDLEQIERFELSRDDLTKWRLQAGDLLIVEGNGSENEIGRCAVWAGDIDPCVYQNHLIRVRCPEPDCIPFIRLFLNSPVGKAEMRRLAITTSGLFSLSVGKIRNYVVPFPPLGEQARIVARVEELMRLCDALEAKGRLEAGHHQQLLTTLLGTLTDSRTPEELADNWQRVADHFDLLLDRPVAVDALERTIFELAVRGMLVPQDANDEPASTSLAEVRAERQTPTPSDKAQLNSARPAAFGVPQTFGLPSGWASATISDLCSVVTDGEHATPKRCEDRTAVPLVTAKNVRSEAMDYARTDFVPRDVAEKCWNRCKPAVGDILMVSVGATLGRLCVLREQREMVLVRSVTVLRPIPKVVDCFYLALHLMAPCSQAEIWSSVKQSAQPCLYLAKSSALKISLPPLSEQIRIVARVKLLRELCNHLHQRLVAGQAVQTHLADALVETAETA